MTQQNVNQPTVRAFTNELIGLITPITAVADRTWSVYDLDDLDDQREFAGFPVVGVAYEGAQPTENVASHGGNFKSAEAQAHRAQVQSVVFLEFRFSVIVGIEYNPTGQRDGTDDTKAVATDLLGEIRQGILGYSGVNTRPWLFEGEAPTGSEIEGVIWYGQVWKTLVPALSQHR